MLGESPCTYMYLQKVRPYNIIIIAMRTCDVPMTSKSESFNIYRTKKKIVPSERGHSYWVLHIINICTWKYDPYISRFTHIFQ